MLSGDTSLWPRIKRFTEALGASTTWNKSALPPVRPLTRGPRFHWFGYYDKLQADPTGRFILGMEVDFEHRSPAANDVVRIGMVDVQDGDRWIELGETTSWNWQQGCMLQWLPNSTSEVLWNERRGEGFICRILDVQSRVSRILPMPVYAVSPDSKWAITTDFSLLAKVRPGYGYAPAPTPARIRPEQESGIWRMDLLSGRTELIVTLAGVCEFGSGPHLWAEAVSWFNHLLVSPDGSRFVFLHRWRRPEQTQGFSTRMLTANADGSGLHVVDPYGKTSHFFWRDPGHILAWAWHPSHGKQFYLYTDQSGEAVPAAPGLTRCDGHCSYLPNRRWILCDTYPVRYCPYQNPYLIDTEKWNRLPLGHFFTSPRYTGEWRSDLHPRAGSDGQSVIIDSTHGGDGRQLYLIDIRGMVG